MSNFKIPIILNVIFSTSLEVRISDINYGHHLGHDSLVSLLHEARLRFIKSLGYKDELNIDGCRMLVTNLVVNYANEAFYSDEITVNIGIGESTKASLQLLYKVFIKETDKEIAKALTTIAFYDDKRLKISKIPQLFLSCLEVNI